MTGMGEGSLVIAVLIMGLMRFQDALIMSASVV